MLRQCIYAALFLLSLPSFAADRPQLSCDELMARLVDPGEVPPLDPRKIRYRVYGEKNKQVVVLIHGLGGSQRTWKQTANDLSKKYKVLVYDQRGHGLTPGEGENYTTGVMASDLHGLMNHLGIKKARLVGHSMGARTAVRFTEKYPDMVEAVALEDMHMLGRKSPMEDLRPLARARKEVLETKFDSIEEATEALRLFHGERLPKDYMNLFVKEGNKYVIDISPTSYTTLYHVNQPLQEDLTDALKSIKVPVLVMQSDPQEHAVLWGRGVEHYQQNKPDATIVGFPHASHGIHGDMPKKYNQTLEDFFAGKKIPNSPLAGAPPKEE